MSLHHFAILNPASEGYDPVPWSTRVPLFYAMVVAAYPLEDVDSCLHARRTDESMALSRAVRVLEQQSPRVDFSAGVEAYVAAHEAMARSLRETRRLPSASITTSEVEAKLAEAASALRGVCMLAEMVTPFTWLLQEMIERIDENLERNFHTGATDEHYESFLAEVVRRRDFYAFDPSEENLLACSSALRGTLDGLARLPMRSDLLEELQQLYITLESAIMLSSVGASPAAVAR